jgi:hypothetical protein
MSTTTRLYSLSKALTEILEYVDDAGEGYVVEVLNDDGEEVLAQVSPGLSDAIENAYYVLNDEEEDEEEVNDHSAFDALDYDDLDEAA